MPDPIYSVFEIQPEWVREPEALGSKEKFMYRAKESEAEWPFKFPQPNPGQHWAEKIAAEIAACLDSLLKLVRRAAAAYPGLFRPALEKLQRFDKPEAAGIIARVPDGWMSALARDFALELVCYNIEQLKRLKP